MPTIDRRLGPRGSTMRPYGPLGRYIRAERLAREWTYAQLAAHISRDVSVAWRLECAKTRPTKATLRRLARAFKVPLAKILEVTFGT